MSFSQSAPIAVYGASGHTGRFVVHELLRRGLEPIAVGRNAARLQQSLPDRVTRRVARTDDVGSLKQAFAGCSVVIHCAGPFVDTAEAVARAALRAGCHYVDVSAEQASTRTILDEFDLPARDAGRVAVPACGFFGGLADLLASALASDGPIDAITVAVGLDRWWPTDGTRRTGVRNTAPRFVVRDGRLAPLLSGDPVPAWEFAAPLGRQEMRQLALSEVIALHHHLEAGSISPLVSRVALDDIHDPRTPPPDSVDPCGRSAQRFELMVRLEQAGATRIAGVRGQDIYAVTAPIVVELARRLMQTAFARSGALTLAQVVDPDDFLSSLVKHGSIELTPSSNHANDPGPLAAGGRSP